MFNNEGGREGTQRRWYIKDWCWKLKMVFCLERVHVAAGETKERCSVCSKREKKQVRLHVGGYC